MPRSALLLPLACAASAATQQQCAMLVQLRQAPSVTLRHSQRCQVHPFTHPTALPALPPFMLFGERPARLIGLGCARSRCAWHGADATAVSGNSHRSDPKRCGERLEHCYFCCCDLRGPASIAVQELGEFEQLRRVLGAAPQARCRSCCGRPNQRRVQLHPWTRH